MIYTVFPIENPKMDWCPPPQDFSTFKEAQEYGENDIRPLGFDFTIQETYGEVV